MKREKEEMRTQPLWALGVAEAAGEADEQEEEEDEEDKEEKRIRTGRLEVARDFWFVWRACLESVDSPLLVLAGWTQIAPQI